VDSLAFPLIRMQERFLSSYLADLLQWDSVERLGWKALSIDLVFVNNKRFLVKNKPSRELSFLLIHPSIQFSFILKLVNITSSVSVSTQ